MRRGFNRNRGRRTYDRMSGRYGGSSAHRGRINKVRVAGAIACLVLAISSISAARGRLNPIPVLR